MKKRNKQEQIADWCIAYLTQHHEEFRFDSTSYLRVGKALEELAEKAPRHRIARCRRDAIFSALYYWVNLDGSGEPLHVPNIGGEMWIEIFDAGWRAGLKSLGRSLI